MSIENFIRPEEYFLSLYKKYGVDERALGWTKHKQLYRFGQVSSYIKNGDSVLDVGCGFADLYGYLKAKFESIEYFGIDIMNEYIEVSMSKFQADNIQLCCADIHHLPWKRTWDWVVECGIFGLKQFNDNEMYEYIEKTICKSLELSETGIAFNFLSDKIDYTTSDTDFHANPEKILGMAYKYSRRVILDNSILPFEYTLVIWKDDSFPKETTVFNKVEESHR